MMMFSCVRKLTNRAGVGGRCSCLRSLVACGRQRRPGSRRERVGGGRGKLCITEFDNVSCLGVGMMS